MATFKEEQYNQEELENLKTDLKKFLSEGVLDTLDAYIEAKIQEATLVYSPIDRLIETYLSEHEHNYDHNRK